MAVLHKRDIPYYIIKQRIKYQSKMSYAKKSSALL